MKIERGKMNDTTGARATFAAAFAMAFTALALLLAPMAARAQTPVNDFAGLQSAIADYASAAGDMEITVAADFGIASGLNIPANANGASLTIRSADAANPVTLTRGVSSTDLFTVNSGAKLVLKDIIIDGDKENPALSGDNRALVQVWSGALTMADGAVLRNNNASYGAGVYIYNGTFTMTGGEISGNNASSSGIVYIYSGAFTMSGGEISGNSALSSGVALGTSGAFTMSGGEISGNNAGIEYSNGTFTLGGAAVISGNINNDVSLSSGSYVTLGTGANAPVPGMNIGVRIAAPDGVIVNSGALPGYEQYFYTEESGKAVIFNNNQLIIADSPYSVDATALAPFGVMQELYVPPAAQTVTITHTGAESVTLTQPSARYYDIGTLSTASLAPGAAATFTVSPKAGLPYGNYDETISIAAGVSGVARINAAVSASFFVLTATEYITASSFADIQDAISGYATATGDVVITVAADFGITAGLTIPANPDGTTLTIRSADAANPVTLRRGVSNANLFTVNSGAKLVLEDIIIDGDKNTYPGNSSPLVYVYLGEFTMADGAVLKNNRNSNYGGGVYVNGGAFTMLGGEISGNTAESRGGGVYVDYVYSGEGFAGVFTMTGGGIIGNTAGSGGGVHTYGGIFTMFGGEISGNTGGGTYVTGVFTMSGGEINNNTGSGVYVESGYTFTMTGGEISNNTGAGITVFGALTLGGAAVISGNANSNAALSSGRYITLGTGVDAPVPDMNIGVRTQTPDGVIVNSGASAGDEQYFYTEESGKAVIFNNNQLIIADSPYSVDATAPAPFGIMQELYVPPAAQTVTITHTGAESITLAQPSARYYDIGTLSTAILAPGASATFTVRPKAGLPYGNYDETISIITGIFGSASVSAPVAAKFTVLTEPVHIPASGFTVMQDAISGYASAKGDVFITVDTDFDITAGLTIPANPDGATLTIRSADAANTATLRRGVSNASLFNVNSGAKLVFENIIIDGDKDTFSSNDGSLVNVSGGEFTLSDGAVLRNNRRTGSGGGVYVSDVYAGGRRVEGLFTMLGGEISGNSASSGGGVYVAYGGVFTILGGEISDNTASSGGGVYITAGGAFTMSGGEINGNNGSSYGGGVYVNGGGALTMTGGEINGNTASYTGGGVFVTSGGEFTMAGGEISGNTASSTSGVYIDNGGFLSLGGAAVISGNVNSNVYLASGRYITLGAGVDAPVPGMNIGVRTQTPDGVIVNSGASAGDEQYFYTEESGKAVIFNNNQLIIADSPYMVNATALAPFGAMQELYVPPAAQTVTITHTGAESITLAQPSAWYYDIGTLSTAILAPGASATFTVSPKAGLPYGNYDETISIITGVSGAAGVSAQVAAKFTVLTEPTHIPASGFTAMQDAISGYASSTGNVFINIDTDFDIAEGLTIPANPDGASLIIRSADAANPATLTRGAQLNLFNVNSGAKLILEDIIIDGDKDNPALSGNSAALVNVSGGGEFILSPGAVLSNNSGGGVYVNNGGAFTMAGGEISDNTAAYGSGGGVYVYNGAFTMAGGEISGNTTYGSGGGVYVYNGAFTMTAGEISDNTASYGGGVYIDGGVFTMSGGEITGNTASSGGGVYSGGAFTMSGGEINGNTASGSGASGGGVYVSGGAFTMSGGEISGNAASGSGASGGGVYSAWWNDEVITLGGTAVISGNAPNNVYLDGYLYSYQNEIAQYITLGAGLDAPATGMSVGVQTAAADGVIVYFGASAADADYFYADSGGKVVSEGGRLRIVDGVFYDYIAYYASETDDAIFTVDRDMALTGVVPILANAAGASLTIRSADAANPFALTRGFDGGCLFAVSAGAKLVLENIIIDGNYYVYDSGYGSRLVCVNGGELTLKDGAVLRNNSGGGVFVSDGEFAMAGGEISGNYSDYAAGVYIGGGEFTMSGGEISGNSASYAGGVYVDGGAFTMTGGEISGNSSSSGDYGGGGVYVRGAFTMAGGEISGNTARLGGGVSVDGAFTMTGGEISGNTANRDGGGVYISGGAFTMTGGEISGNDANRDGGGVYVFEGELTLGGTAVISGNAPSNVHLSYYPGQPAQYITLGAGINAPATGMNVGVLAEMPSGVIVYSGAGAGDEMYFFADEPGKFVFFQSGQLVIAASAPAVTMDSITVTLPSKTVYAVGESLNLAGMAVTAFYSDGSSKTVTGYTASPANGAVLNTAGQQPVTVSYTENGVTITERFNVTVNSSDPPPDHFAALQDAIAGYAYAASDIFIDVAADFDIAAGLVIPANAAGASLTIRSAYAANPVILSRGVSNAGLFAVDSGAKLVLENIIIDGGKDNPALSGNNAALVNVYDGGEFILSDGAVLRNNGVYPAEMAFAAGGGVYVEGGEFIMNGGEISGNAVSSDYDSAVGGGVYVYSGAFTMLGGLISGNAADDGGGVYVNAGSFAMDGGEISGNVAESRGGGVYVSIGAFTMADGAVLGDNTAYYSGGGVFVSDGEFAMAGGEISGNSAADEGGGVSVQSGGVFAMSGGEISGNDAWRSGNSGGGVYSGGKFTMTGGEISGNDAWLGGGVYVDDNGVFTMSGGLISDNTARHSGGVYSYGEFTMFGGEISGNTASGSGSGAVRGGGVYVSEGEFTLGGTAVINGNAPSNVYLGYSPGEPAQYITLGAGINAPATGMNVGVLAGIPSGVIVYSGAGAGDEMYFFADEPGKTVVFRSGQLVIETMVSAETIEIAAEQNFVYGSWYFAPVDLAWEDGYRYEITERPDTLGGFAPFVNIYGQFVFGHQMMPVNISREGVYTVEVSSGGTVVAVYEITIWYVAEGWIE